MSCDGHGASLKVRGLSYAPTGARSLIKNVDFTLDAGERLAIIGPNGAGKTSLLRCLYRAVRPSEGKVLLDGQDVWAIDPRTVARRIAVVVQEMPADFPFTVEDIVMMGRIPWQKSAWKRSKGTGDDKARALHAMDHLHITDLARRDFATLSGGEKQRVLVARALAQDPQLLILDEPSNHLDIRNQLEILDLLRGLGITIVTTLHDINLAAGFATRAIILKDGQMIAEGCPRDVLTADHLSAAFTVQTHVHSLDGGATRNFSFALSA
ncbi:ABC transporter ATP-binding protein [Agrobacterium vitis]|nr:ABC transporter ATP-binding protein [Agrobacterium vitis]MCM2452463.1 ABC transporter ATP-binding protein [Agrobacterium vitis]MCM2470879.1 ABC transporter ATP-binding protein [Agrobacterium vitis]